MIKKNDMWSSVDTKYGYAMEHIALIIDNIKFIKWYFWIVILTF